MGHSRKYNLLLIGSLSFSLAVCKQIPIAKVDTAKFEGEWDGEQILSPDESIVNNRGNGTQSDIIEDGRIGTRNFFRGNKWLNQRIPVYVDPSFPQGSPEWNQLRISFDDFRDKTCLRFVTRLATDNDYIHILRDDVISHCGQSNTCRIGGRQDVRIGRGCMFARTMIHELGHAICMGHEFTRSDRDEYVYFQNSCTPEAKVSLSSHTNPSYFDYFSVMMYWGGGPNDCQQSHMTIPDKWFGNTGRLSVLDADKINEFYECGGCYAHRWRFIDQLTGSDYVEPAGNENGIALIICRFYVNGEIIVGKGSISMKACWVPYGDSERGSGSQKFEVLTNPGRNLRWVPSTKGAALPAGSIPGGRKLGKYDLVPETYYIARCPIGANVIPGALHGNSRSMFYQSGGRANDCSNFHVLTCV